MTEKRITVLTTGSYSDYRIVGVARGDILKGKWLKRFREEYEYPTYKLHQVRAFSSGDEYIKSIESHISAEMSVENRLVKDGLITNRANEGISLGFARWAKAQGANIEIETWDDINV